MEKWEVTFPMVGNFEFVGDFEVTGVTFSKNKINKEYEAKIIIEKNSRTEAIKEAQEKIETILDTISFVKEVGCEMGYPSVFQKDSEEMVQFTRIQEFPLIIGIHQKIIKKVYENLDTHFKDNSKEMLALRWYRKGCFFNNPVDKFLAFWISLESLTGEDGKSERKNLPFEVKNCIECVKQKVVEDNNLMSQVIQSIHSAYKPIHAVMEKNIQNILNNKDVDVNIKKIYDDRGKIVHGHQIDSIDIIAHNNYLKRLLGKILRVKLDVVFNNFINSWPSSEIRRRLNDDYLKIESIKCVLSKYPKGATLDEIVYGLFSLKKELERPKDIHNRLEVLINNGHLRNQKINNEERYFSISD